jgi:hypothetical protein
LSGDYTKTNRTFMNMAYGYDAVGNVKTLANAAAVPANLNYLPGCQTAYSFGYDDLYQLTSTTASCAKPGLPTDKFTLSMSYDSIHNITRKTQAAVKVLGGSTTPNVTVSYDWTYAYGGTRPARSATAPSSTTSTAIRPAGMRRTAARTAAMSGTRTTG